MVLATEFAGPNAFGGISWLEFGRVRPVHVNGVILLWTSMAFWGAIFYMLPRLLGTRSMWHERWLIWIGWLYNVFGVLVVVSIPLGFTTGREYWEPIWPLKVIFEICLVVNIFSVLMTIQMRVVRPLYVTVWWSVAAPMWLAADYFIGGIMWSPGNFWGNQIPWGVGQPLPQSALSSSLADGLLEWWGAHNIFGLWLTPMFIAVAYYMVPRITNTPLYSHTLSLISFCGMAFFYTGVGHHHLLQTPTPGWLINPSAHLEPRIALSTVVGQFVALRTPLADVCGDIIISARFKKRGGLSGGGYGVVLRDQGPDPRDGISQAGQYAVIEIATRDRSAPGGEKTIDV